MSTEHLVEVIAPGWRAYLVMVGERCTAADLRIRWTKGRTRTALRAEFERRGWSATVIQTTTARAV